jgi:glycosyltransferase
MIISIITISFNNVDTIESTMQSVLSQTYQNIEYIVIDGASTDGTVEIIHKYESALSKWVSEPDDGIYDALNKGIAMATGDVVGFLHADDIFYDFFVVAEVMDIFQKNQCHAVYSDLVYVARNDSQNVFRFWKSCPFEPKLLKRGWMPPHPALFIHRAVYEKYGVFNADLRISADYDLILRFFSRPDFVSEYLPHVIVRMRTGGVSNRSIGNILRKSREDYRAMKNNKTGGFITLLWNNLSKLSQLRIFKK